MSNMLRERRLKKYSLYNSIYVKFLKMTGSRRIVAWKQMRREGRIKKQQEEASAGNGYAYYANCNGLMSIHVYQTEKFKYVRFIYIKYASNL